MSQVMSMPKCVWNLAVVVAIGCAASGPALAGGAASAASKPAPVLAAAAKPGHAPSVTASRQVEITQFTSSSPARHR